MRGASSVTSGWTFWITLSILVFFGVFLVPSLPGLSVILAILVLLVGKAYFIKRPLTAKDIINSLIIILIMSGVYVILSLRFFAAMPAVTLLAAAVILDVVLSVWYIFSTIGRIVLFRWTITGRRFSLILQSLVAGLIVTLVVFWFFGSGGVFVYPVFMILGMFVKPWLGRGFFPIITVSIIFVKLLSVALT